MKKRLVKIALTTLALIASAYADVISTISHSQLPLSGGVLTCFRTDQTMMTIIGFVGNAPGSTNECPTGNRPTVQFSSSTVLGVGGGNKAGDIKPPTTDIKNMTITTPGNMFSGLRVDVFGIELPGATVTVTLNNGVTLSPFALPGDQSHLFVTLVVNAAERSAGVSMTEVAISAPNGFASLRNFLIAGIDEFEPPDLGTDGKDPDDVVPEPSSMLLLGSGVLVFAQVLRRKLLKRGNGYSQARS